MGADLEGEILGVNPERVEAERLEDRVPLEPLESSIDVVAREREEVADVQSFRGRVRKHHQGVERAHAAAEVRVVRPARFPALLPFSLDGGRIVRRPDRRPRFGRSILSWYIAESSGR